MNRLRLILMVIGVFLISISFAIDPFLQKKDNASLIQKIIEESNEMLFSKRGLHLELLKNYPEALPALAEWEYQNWHSYNTSLTSEQLEKGLCYLLNDNSLPI